MPNRVAVLIPVYNDRRGLMTSLRSLQGAKCDVMIVDDGSIPPINQAECAKVLPDCEVVRQSPNTGIVGALNRGVELLLSRGHEYIARLDAGDRSMPTRLQEQEQFLNENKSVMLVGSDTEFLSAEGEVIHVQRGPHDWDKILRKMHINSCFAHPAVMIRASVFALVGSYRSEDICAEDYGLFFRIAKRFPVANLPRVLTLIELNQGGISLSRRSQQLRSRLHIQLSNFDLRLPESYWGVLHTLALMLTPRRVTRKLKQMIYRPIPID